MHSDPILATALIETMKSADKIARFASKASTRKAAAQLRDKAFAQFVWG